MKNNIKQFREAAGMTQHQLGVAIGLSSAKPQATISNYEAQIRSPGLHTCRLIVMALNKAGVEATMDSVFPLDMSKSA